MAVAANVAAGDVTDNTQLAGDVIMMSLLLWHHADSTTDTRRLNTWSPPFTMFTRYRVDFFNNWFQEPRAEFYGELGKDAITGRLQPQYSNLVRLMKFYGVSVPVMLVAMVIAWLVMLLYFYLEEYVKPMLKGDASLYGKFLTQLPTIVYAVIVLVLNAIYQPLAVALNNWGNYLWQEGYVIPGVICFYAWKQLLL